MTNMMKKLALGTATIAIAFAGPACAQQHTPTPVASTQVPAETVEMAGPALWLVSDEDTKIYLFGTVHVLPDGVEWYTPTIENALTSSDIMVTEIEMNDEAMANMQQLVMSTGMLPAETSLRSLLDEEEKATYETALTKLGMPVGAFDRFEPWMAGITLTTLPLLKEGYSPEAGVEKKLEQLAGPDIARGALETIEFQLGLFASMEQDAQIEFLVATAGAVDDIKPMLDKMVAEWAAGDADALAELMNEEMDDPEVAEALLYGRNANWAEWIQTRLDQPGTVFMAVGAGHLAGDKSVQDMLETRGIQSVRVQ